MTDPLIEQLNEWDKISPEKTFLTFDFNLDEGRLNFNQKKILFNTKHIRYSINQKLENIRVKCTVTNTETGNTRIFTRTRLDTVYYSHLTYKTIICELSYTGSDPNLSGWEVKLFIPFEED